MQDAPRLNLDATDLRVGLVISAYHEEVTDRLRRGAIDAFCEAGGDKENIFEVVAPGAFELVPLVAALVEKELNGVVALGCVIRGETTHDEHLCRSVSQALAQLASENGVPIGFGLLTCFSMEQAMERAGGAKGNKGEEAMNAFIVTARSLEVIEEQLASDEDEEDEDEEDEVLDTEEEDNDEYEYEDEYEEEEV